MTSTAAGLIDTAKRSEVAWADYGPMSAYSDYTEYPYLTDMTAALTQYNVNMSQIFGFYYTSFAYSSGYFCKYKFYEFTPAATGYTLVIGYTSGDYGGIAFRIKKVVGSNLVDLNSSDSDIIRMREYTYYTGSSLPGTAPAYSNVAPNVSSGNALTAGTYVSSGSLSYPRAGYTGSTYVPSLRDPVSKVLSLAIIAGMHVVLYMADGSAYGTIPLDSADLKWITEVPTAATPTYTVPRDTILNPGESIDVDLGRIADALGGITEQVDAIAAGLEAGSTLELLKLLLDLSNTDTLTQTAVATTTDPIIDPTSTYPIPGLSNVWKYVTYMFSTLGGWITYCGNCLQAVTVGEGGLSWIFYGAFIFIICGGFIGKLLL